MTQEPLVLAIETSSRIGSVAVATGERLLKEITFSGPMRHSAELFPAIGALLYSFGRRARDIEQVYISIGPGSFTGLRIAVTLAKSIHLANSAKIVSVDTLDVIAANVINLDSMGGESRASSIEIIAPILDAKRGQFYISVYQKDRGSRCKNQNVIPGTKHEKILLDSLMTRDDFLEKFACVGKPIWLLGDGLLYHKDEFRADGVRFFEEQFWGPRASKVHQLGWRLALANQFVDPLKLTPHYIRTPSVTPKTK